MQSVVTEKSIPIRPNRLNNLSGKEWIKSTKTWFVLKPSKRTSKKMHPASYPEELAEKYIKFFTKQGEWVFDPFLGTGSSLLASTKLNRNGIGIELYKKYYQYSMDCISSINNGLNKNIILNTDARDTSKVFSKYDLQEISLCLTSPPYWNQLNKNNKRQKNRINENLDTEYGNNYRDLSLIDDYHEFINELGYVFDQVYDITKNNGHLIVVTNNVYKDGRVWPLAFDIFRHLSKKWIPRDEQIWCQDDRKLFPFGIFSTYVGNRSHHYCLIFQKKV